MLKKIPYFMLIVILLTQSVFAQTYKQMMLDPSVNYYDVVKEADNYFENRDKGKGSGWAPYQRWKYATESHFYPSGIRSNSSPYFAQEAYSTFIKQVDNSNRRIVANDNGWKDLGPYRVEKISGHYAPGLGIVQSFYVNPNDTMRIYLGSKSGGFWRTIDGGKTWTGTTDFLPASGISSIAVSPTNPDIVLINVRNGSNGVTQGVYRSNDGGLTWSITKFNPTNLKKGGLGSNFSINKVVFSPHVPGMIFISANDGLYRSVDNLETWTKVINGGVTEIEFHPSNASLVYVYDYTGSNRNVILRSINQGVTFAPTNTIVGNNDNTSVNLSVSTLGCQDCLFFASNNGVWKSTDNGNSFTFLSNPKTGNGAFAVNDINPNNMITGGIDVVGSTDGGLNFKQTTWWALGKDRPFAGPNYVHADLRVAKCIRGAFYLGTDGFLSKSNDGGNTWVILSQGTGIRENYAVGTSQSNTYRNICGSQDNGQSLLTENGWLEIYGADGMEGIIHPLNSNWMIGSWQFGGRLRTKDGSKTNQGVTPPSHGDKHAAWVAPLYYDPNNHMIVYSIADSVFKSINYGTTWENLGPTSIGTVGKAVIAENNSDIMILTTGSKIVKSIDGGKTFLPIKGLPNYSISDVAIDPKDDNTIIVSYNRYQKDSSKVFISRDLGLTWQNITYNLADMPIYTVVIDHSSASNIYLGGEIGVFAKSIDATAWTLVNDKLPNCSTFDLEIQYGTNTLRAATWGRGLWEHALNGRSEYPKIPLVVSSLPPTDNQPIEGSQVMISAAVTYNEKLSKVFIKWSKDTPDFTNTLAMKNIKDTTFIAVSAMPDFPAGTKIYFKVYAIGSNQDTTETYKFMYTVSPFKYCDAVGADGTGGDYVNYVSLAGVANKSNQEKYGDFTKTFIELVTDSLYTLQIGMNYHFDPDTTAAWIDYNHNAVFEKNEQIVMSKLDSTHKSIGTFRVPKDVAKDTTRLRVRSQYFSETPEPCGSRTGEVEDYTIVFKHSAPKITYIVDQTTLCRPSFVRFTYTGDNVDSLQWELNNSVLKFTSSSKMDSIKLTTKGIYKLQLITYKNGVVYPASNQQTITLNSIDTGVTRVLGGLQAKADSATYQWLNCSDAHHAITGAISKTYKPQIDGLFAVEIHQNGCVDTSLCFNVQAVGVDELCGEDGLSFYPNPTTGIIEVDLKSIHSNVFVKIFDGKGKIVSTHSFDEQSKVKLHLNNLPNGVYYLELTTSKGITYHKVVKNNGN